MDCLYCQNNDTLHSLMIEIAELCVSHVSLFKEQIYRGVAMWRTMDMWTTSIC